MKDDKEKYAITMRINKAENDIVRELDILKGHTDSERFARKLYLASPLRIFHLNTDY